MNLKLAILILSLACVAGCKSTPSDSGSRINEGAAAIGAYTNTQRAAVASIVGHESEKRVIVDAADRIDGEAAGIVKAKDILEGELARERNWRIWFESRWYVRWGQRAEWAVWIIGIGAVIAAAIYFVRNPIGSVATWGGGIVSRLIGFVFKRKAGA